MHVGYVTIIDTAVRPLRLLIDQDAVLAAWGDLFNQYLERYGDEAALIPRAEVQEVWDIKHGRTERECAIIDEIMNAPGFYRELVPIPGAVDAIARLAAAGHTIFIVTSPFVTNPTCASDKLDWVTRYLGPEWAKRVVITSDKTIVRGDFLIDDKPEITGDETPEWQHIVFGEYRYNAHLEGVRLRRWDDVESVIESLLVAA